jgi:hypothetical protein
MKTARMLRKLDWSSNVCAYALSEPHEGASLVIVSAVIVPFTGPETYIFPATAESLERNEPSSWIEMNGSYRGGLNHAEALRRAGYEVA